MCMTALTITYRRKFSTIQERLQQHCHSTNGPAESIIYTRQIASGHAFDFEVNILDCESRWLNEQGVKEAI